ENFTSYTPYESNLKTLINSLIYKTPSTGFGIGSVGLTQYQNQQAYGLAICRGDFSLLNVQNVDDPIKFNNVTKDLLSLLAYEASMDKKMYANGELKIGELERVYGQAQCTRDLSSVDCKKCLDDAISEISNCCNGKKGGRVVGGSCNVRYEIYPFVRE
ncbi:hypothetical protein RYX36_030858, partial [Vicia faba]